MPVPRVHWEDLPGSTRQAVEKHAGPVLQAVTVSEGLNSGVAAILTTESGQVFAKGLRAGYPRRWTQDKEALINPYVAALSPRLLWRVQDEWDMLGFELIKGHHASYAPGSPDLPAVTALMTALGEIRCPDEPVKHAPHRWRSYADDPKDLDWLDGDRLLHTDWNPLNVPPGIPRSQPRTSSRTYPPGRPHQARTDRQVLSAAQSRGGQRQKG